MTEYQLITWGPGGTYYLVPVAEGGYRLAHDPQGRRIASYRHVYATEAEAREAAHRYATY